MKTRWLLSLVALFILLCTNALLAQLLTGADVAVSSRYEAPPIITQEASVQERAERNGVLPNADPPFQTDEYGYFSFNAYLTGLGATGGYVAIPGAFNENVDGSVEAWVYPTATTSSAPCIVGKGDSTAVGFLFGWSASTSLLYMRFGSTPTTNTGGTTVPLNQWTHVAATWSGGAGNYTVTFYVNGALSGSPVTNTGTWLVSSDSMTIGSMRAPFGGKAFYGDIDEVRYWQDVRTASEIATSRFVGLGDIPGANTGNALTSSSSYSSINASFNFNVGGSTAPDYVGGLTGSMRNGAFTVYSPFAPQPIPYNFALLCPGGVGDYVSVPSNTAFNQTAAGSVEAWVKLSSVGVLQPILQKGASFAATTLAFYVTSSNKVGINIGSHNYISTGPATLIANKWYHVAATWTGGPNFTVRLYIDGVLDDTQTFNLAMPVNTDTLWIGRYYGAQRFNGYVDELRMWGSALSQQQIVRNMFVSGRSLLPNANIVGIWNFDGSLMNFSATASINGSFGNGGTNNSRLSAFANEANTSALSNSFEAHATVVNHGGSPNPFPLGFAVKAPGKKINDNSTMRDTIAISSGATLTTIEVFMAIRHTYCADLNITLTAPNGQSRDLSSGNGGTGMDILTFFVDGSTSLTTAGFFPPWTNSAAPEVAMGNFGSTTTQGNWILTVQDVATADTGWLAGWGLRFNNATGVGPTASEIPDRFELLQNYPNPFNPATTIDFSIPKEANVNIGVYNILGQLVTTLVNDRRKAGSYSVQFNANNFTSGTYFYRIMAGDYVDTKKMLLLK